LPSADQPTLSRTNLFQLLIFWLERLRHKQIVGRRQEINYIRTVVFRSLSTRLSFRLAFFRLSFLSDWLSFGSVFFRLSFLSARLSFGSVFFRPDFLSAQFSFDPTCFRLSFLSTRLYLPCLNPTANSFDRHKPRKWASCDSSN
jgi:hypothetical protein